MEKAKKFKRWITKTILPSIRKFGQYKLKKEHDTIMHEITRKLNFLEKENEKLKNELKTEKYPDGALIYFIDYTDEEENVYRLGQTNNLNHRKKIYDTHTINKKKVAFKEEVSCPIQYEICLKSMLYQYRIKNRKDFYKCHISKIEEAFEKCNNSITCMNQTGGNLFNTSMVDFFINTFNTELNKIKAKYKQITKLHN